MGRTSAGVLMLALAVAAFAVLTALGRPPRTGEATRADPPVPPAVGSCGSMSSGELLLVECGRLHTVEVVGTWRPPDPAPAPSFGACSGQARRYVGMPPANDPASHPKGRWSLPMRYRPMLAWGPGPLVLPAWSWQVCLVVATGPAPWSGYRDSIRDLAADGTGPAAMRLCYLEPGQPLTVVSCARTHAGEIVGVLPTDAASAVDPVSRGDWDRSCSAAAAAFTGSPDPTFGGGLSVSVLPRSGQSFSGPLSADIGVYYTVDGGPMWLVCAVEGCWVTEA